MTKNDFLGYGFHVLDRQTHLIVTTPQTFASGDPARFFVSKRQGEYLFSDYGTTHNALELSLPNPDGVDDLIIRTLDRLDNHIKFQDYTLSTYTNDIRQSIADFVNLYALLTTYQPKTKIEQDVSAVLASIEKYLLGKYGQAEKNVKIKGLSGTAHHFAFQADTHIFEFAEPLPRTTGTLLRKIHDVKSVYNDLDFSIFLNDLGNKKQFEKEAHILSGIAHIKPASLLLVA